MGEEPGTVIVETEEEITIVDQAGREVTVTPVDSAAYPTKAVRPHNSRMSKQALVQAGFKPLPRWQDAVGRYLMDLKERK